MHPANDFDPSAYMTTPPLDVPSQIALGRQLSAAAPADLPKPAEFCKRALNSATLALEEGYRHAQQEAPGLPKRPIDAQTDNSWACIKSRLEPYTWLDESRFPEATTAQSLMQKLFPNGLSFTQLEYGAQWAEASWRLKMLEEQKLEDDLRRLCGDVFVDELVHWHAEYGKMIGVAAPRRGVRSKGEAEPRQSLADLRRQAAQAVVAWQAQLVALHFAGHPGARAALRPTDEYREKLAAAASAKRPPAPEPTLSAGVPLAPSPAIPPAE